MGKELVSEKQIKRKNFWDKLTFALVAIFLALSAVLSITLIYQKSYFNVKWVNGQSMYPTFNKDAVDRNGNPKGIGGASANNGDKNFDCVIWDGHQETFSKLERFDIVILTNPVDSSKDLIKRVIAMPGETFYFGSGDDNGSLYIMNQSGTYDLVPQPVDNYFVTEGSYNFYHTPTTLKDDEYFVCGDNRLHSTDSRELGPINRSYMLGIVVAVVGKADAVLNDQGRIVYTNLRIGWPRWIK